MKGVSIFSAPLLLVLSSFCSARGVSFQKKWFFFLLFICSIPAHSFTGNQGPFKVSSLRVNAANGATGGMYVALKPAPPGCEGGDQYRMHLQINPTSPFFKELVAGLLAAYTSGNTIDYVWFSNEGVCTSNHILQLEMYEMTPK